jgi:hypothetical protein
LCALVAGCGGEERAPQLPAGLAESLAARSDAVAERLAAGDECAAQDEAEALQRDAIEAVNGRRVPEPHQETLLGSAAALVETIDCGGDGETAGARRDARRFAGWLRENAAESDAG